MLQNNQPKMSSKAPIYVNIDKDLKVRVQHHTLDLSIDLQSYVSLALKHFADHIDNKDIPASNLLFSE